MKRLTTALAVLAIVVVPACGSDDDSGSSGSTAARGTSEAAETTSDSAPVDDACALIDDATITELIGDHPPGSPTGAGTDAPGCVWENPDNYYSVTVDIGSPGTAVNGTLPPLPEGIEGTPAPNGMRYLGGALEFAAGGRYNSVQIANNQPGDATDAKTVELAESIADQLS